MKLNIHWLIAAWGFHVSFASPLGQNPVLLRSGWALVLNKTINPDIANLEISFAGLHKKSPGVETSGLRYLDLISSAIKITISSQTRT